MPPTPNKNLSKAVDAVASLAVGSTWQSPEGEASRTIVGLTATDDGLLVEYKSSAYHKRVFTASVYSFVRWIESAGAARLDTPP